MNNHDHHHGQHLAHDQQQVDAQTTAGQHEMAGMGMGMKMYLHFSTGDMVLFRGVVLADWSHVFAACCVSIVGAILYEALAFLSGVQCGCELRDFLASKEQQVPLTGRRNFDNPSRQPVGQAETAHTDGPAQAIANNRRCNGNQPVDELPACRLASGGGHWLPPLGLFWFKSLLYGLQALLAYLLMLVAMTYNGYLILALALGE